MDVLNNLSELSHKLYYDKNISDYAANRIIKSFIDYYMLKEYDIVRLSEETGILEDELIDKYGDFL